METYIAAELPSDYVRRMRNWARSSSEFGLVSISSIYDGQFSGRGETRLPMLIGEATDTHRALCVLVELYREPVSLFWRHEGKGLRWLGRTLDISDKTAKVRVLAGSELHQQELRRRAIVLRTMVDENRRMLAESTANYSRTGSISVHRIL